MGGFGSILDQPTRGQTQADVDAALAARGPGPTIGPATPQPTTPDALRAAQAAWMLRGLNSPGDTMDPRSLFNGPNRFNPNPAPKLPPAQVPDVSSTRGVLRPSRPMGYDDYLKLADMAAGTIGLTPPHPNMSAGERLQNLAAIASLGAGPLAEEFSLSRLAGRASKAIEGGGTFDVSTGEALKGSGYLVADPDFTRPIFPHENPKQAIKAFLRDPQVQRRLAAGDAHLGVYTNPDGLPEVNVTDRVPLDEGAARDLARQRGQNTFGHLVDGEYQGDVPVKRDFTGRRVTGVALEDMQGNVHSKPLPATHVHVLNDLPPNTALKSRGFTLDNGTYVSPEEAMDVAEQNDQIATPGRYERNRSNERDLHAFDLRENQPQPPQRDFSVAAEGPAEHLANAQSILDMHAHMSGAHSHLEPADLGAVADRVRKAGQSITITPQTTIGDLQAQIRGMTPSTNAAPSTLDHVTAEIRARAGLTHEPLPPVGKVDPDVGRHLSRAYDQLQSAPDDPQVQGAYRQFVSETALQARELKKAGYSWEFTDKDPYANSAEMLQDLHDNKHIKVLRTQPGQGHPLLSNDENNEFRAVHDILGHGSTGASFGPRGEEQAYRNHSALYSPASQRVLATETRGQNSWFNYGPHSGLPVKERPFAQQKAALFPAHLTGDYPDIQKAMGTDYTGRVLNPGGEISGPRETSLVPYQPRSTALVRRPAPVKPTNVLGENLSREDAVAQMKDLSAKGVRAQMRPNKDGTFSIVRKGAPGAAVAKAPTPQPMGLLGEATDAGFQSRLMTAVSGNPKYADLKLTPQEWYNRLKNDPNVPKDELDKLGLHSSGITPEHITAERDRLHDEYKQHRLERYQTAVGMRSAELQNMENAAKEIFQEPEGKHFADEIRKAFPSLEPTPHADLPEFTSDDRDRFNKIFDQAVADHERYSTSGSDLTSGEVNDLWRPMNRAYRQHEEAAMQHNLLRNAHPEKFTAEAMENLGDGIDRGAIEALQDEKGKIAQGDLAHHIQSNSVVGRLEKNVLTAEGGAETPEPDEEAISDRAEELRNEWMEDQHHEAERSLDARDLHLGKAESRLKELFGAEGSQRIHQALVDKHFADSEDILRKRDDSYLPNHLDQEDLAKSLQTLLEDEHPTQGLLFPNEHPVSHNDLAPAAFHYGQAAMHESEAINSMEAYHNPDDQGPDFYGAARDQFYEDYQPQERDKGDTKYSDYQRVDEEAPYREILIRDPEQERTATHWDDEPGVIAHARGEIHGSNYHMLEAQSDLAQKLNKMKRSGMGGWNTVERSLSPFHTTERWAQLATGASLHQAAQEGMSSFSWPTPADRIAKASLAPKSANITYGQAVPKAVERIFKHLDEPMEMGEHRAGGGGTTFPKVKLTPAMREKILKMGVPALSTIPFLAPRIRGGLLGDQPAQ